MLFTRLFFREGRLITSSPVRTIPEAIVPAKPRKSRFGRLTSKDIDKTIRAEAVRLRHVTEELGGTFIKLAQQASIRRDVLPEIYCDELASLQDRVPGMSIEEVHRIIEEQIGRPPSEVFSSIDPTPTSV